MDRPTKSQQQLLEFISAFIKQHGYGPSYREIMRALDYKSVSTVAIHVNGLITRGLLRKHDRSARSLEVVSALQQAPIENAMNHEEWLKQRLKKHAESDQSSKETLQNLAQSFEHLGLSELRKYAEAYLGKD